MGKVIFNYEGNNSAIQCSINDKLKDIIDKFLKKREQKENVLYYLYNGTDLQEELIFKEQASEQDKKRTQMSILVYRNIKDINQQKKEIISKEIIC